MSVNEENVRCNFAVPAPLFKRIKKLPWGVRANLIRIILEKLCDSIDAHGEVMIGAVLSGEYALVYQPKDSVQSLDSSSKKGRKK